jgi:hypothetical protein
LYAAGFNLAMVIKTKIEKALRWQVSSMGQGKYMLFYSDEYKNETVTKINESKYVSHSTGYVRIHATSACSNFSCVS